MSSLRNVKGGYSEDKLSIHGSCIAAANICRSLEENCNDKGGWISTKNTRDLPGNEKESRKETCRTKTLDIVESDLKRSSSLGKRDAQIEDHNSNVAPSKWFCPSKKKLNLGPPMKQLRLERWIKRVT